MNRCNFKEIWQLFFLLMLHILFFFRNGVRPSSSLEFFKLLPWGISGPNLIFLLGIPTGRRSLHPFSLCGSYLSLKSKHNPFCLFELQLKEKRVPFLSSIFAFCACRCSSVSRMWKNNNFCSSHLFPTIQYNTIQYNTIQYNFINWPVTQRKVQKVCLQHCQGTSLS